MITQADADEYLRTIRTHFEPRLTEWEHHFVRDLQAQRNGLRHLSEKQREVLDRLMTKLAAQHGRDEAGDE